MCTLRPQTNTLEPQWYRIANSLIATQGKLNPVLKYYTVEAGNPYDELEWETLFPLTYQEEVRERLQLLFHLRTSERELNPTTSSQAKCLSNNNSKKDGQAFNQDYSKMDGTSLTRLS